MTDPRPDTVKALEGDIARDEEEILLLARRLSRRYRLRQYAVEDEVLRILRGGELRDEEGERVDDASPNAVAEGDE